MTKKKPIVSKEGQWKYPGQETIIPNVNGRITMQGVPYPVFGIDDLGNQQMMMPGAEYQFPGNSVYEIPMPNRNMMDRGFDRGSGKSTGVSWPTELTNEQRALDDWQKLTSNGRPTFEKRIPAPDDKTYQQLLSRYKNGGTRKVKIHGLPKAQGGSEIPPIGGPPEYETVYVTDPNDPAYQEYLYLQNLYNWSNIQDFDRRSELSFPGYYGVKDGLYTTFAPSEYSEVYNKYTNLPYNYDAYQGIFNSNNPGALNFNTDELGYYGSKANRYTFNTQAELDNFIAANQALKPSMYRDTDHSAAMQQIIDKYTPIGYDAMVDWKQPYISTYYSHNGASNNPRYLKPTTPAIEDNVNREALRNIYPGYSDEEIDKVIATKRLNPQYVTNTYEDDGTNQYLNFGDTGIEQNEDPNYAHPTTLKQGQYIIWDDNGDDSGKRTNVSPYGWSPNAGVTGYLPEDFEDGTQTQRATYLPRFGPPESYLGKKYVYNEPPKAQESNENYTLHYSGNPGVAYLHYKKRNEDGTFTEKNLGATQVKDWLDDEQQKQFHSPTGGTANVNYNPDIKIYSDVKDANSEVEKFRKQQKNIEKRRAKEANTPAMSFKYGGPLPKAENGGEKDKPKEKPKDKPKEEVIWTAGTSEPWEPLPEMTPEEANQWAKLRDDAVGITGNFANNAQIYASYKKAKELGLGYDQYVQKGRESAQSKRESIVPKTIPGFDELTLEDLNILSKLPGSPFMYNQGTGEYYVAGPTDSYSGSSPFNTTSLMLDMHMHDLNRGNHYNLKRDSEGNFIYPGHRSVFEGLNKEINNIKNPGVNYGDLDKIAFDNFVYQVQFSTPSIQLPPNITDTTDPSYEALFKRKMDFKKFSESLGNISTDDYLNSIFQKQNNPNTQQQILEKYITDNSYMNRTATYGSPFSARNLTNIIPEYVYGDSPEEQYDILNAKARDKYIQGELNQPLAKAFGTTTENLHPNVTRRANAYASDRVAEKAIDDVRDIIGIIGPTDSPGHSPENVVNTEEFRSLMNMDPKLLEAIVVSPWKGGDITLSTNDNARGTKTTITNDEARKLLAAMNSIKASPYWGYLAEPTPVDAMIQGTANTLSWMAGNDNAEGPGTIGEKAHALTGNLAHNKNLDLLSTLGGITDFGGNLLKSGLNFSQATDVPSYESGPLLYSYTDPTTAKAFSEAADMMMDPIGLIGGSGLIKKGLNILGDTSRTLRAPRYLHSNLIDANSVGHNFSRAVENNLLKSGLGTDDIAKFTDTDLLNIASKKKPELFTPFPAKAYVKNPKNGKSVVRLNYRDIYGPSLTAKEPKYWNNLLGRTDIETGTKLTEDMLKTHYKNVFDAKAPKPSPVKFEGLQFDRMKTNLGGKGSLNSVVKPKKWTKVELDSHIDYILGSDSKKDNVLIDIFNSAQPREIADKLPGAIVNTLIGLGGLTGLALEADDYVNPVIQKYAPALYHKLGLGSDNLLKKHVAISLNDEGNTLSTARVNDNSADGNVILGGEFIFQNPNTVNTPEWFKNNPTVQLGDPSSDYGSVTAESAPGFWGVENGKIKAGPLNEFAPDTKIVPMRPHSNAWKPIGKAGSVDGHLRFVDRDNNIIYNNAGTGGKILLYSPTTKAAHFVYNTGDSEEVANTINNLIAADPDLRSILLDNGRYSHYIDKGDEKLDENDFKDYTSGDVGNPGNPGFNLVLKRKTSKKLGGVINFRNGGQLPKGGDISVPGLKRVKIHNLPKAQYGPPRVKAQEIQDLQDKYAVPSGYVRVPDVVRQLRIAKGIPADQIPEFEKIEEKKISPELQSIVDKIDARRAADKQKADKEKADRDRKNFRPAPINDPAGLPSVPIFESLLMAPIALGEAGLAGLGELVYGAASSSPLIQATAAGTRQLLSAAPKAIPWLNAGNALTYGFGVHGANAIRTGEVAKPWIHANATGNPIDYANAFGSNLITALELAPFAAPVLKAGYEIAKPAMNAAGEFLTTQTPLRNAYKINPWAFKPDAGAAYRMIGNEAGGYADAVHSGVFRPNPTRNYQATFYNVGAPFERYGAMQASGKGPQYVAKVPLSNPKLQARFEDDVFRVTRDNHVGINEPGVQILKENWLQGYKPVKIGSPGNTPLPVYPGSANTSTLVTDFSDINLGTTAEASSEASGVAGKSGNITLDKWPQLFGKRTAESVPMQLGPQAELDLANARAKAFSESAFNKLKLQRFRPGQKFDVTNQEAMFMDDSRLAKIYNDYHTQDPTNPATFNEWFIEGHAPNGPSGRFGAQSFGDTNDIVGINRVAEKTGEPSKSILLDTSHETTHSRSLRLKSTQAERDIATDAWKPMVDDAQWSTGPASGLNQAAEESFAVQNELRTLLNDFDGSRVYTNNDIPEIQNALQKLASTDHPYLTQNAASQIDMKKLIKSLNVIGLGATVPVIINATQEKKKGGQIHKLQRGGPLPKAQSTGDPRAQVKGNYITRAQPQTQTWGQQVMAGIPGYPTAPPKTKSKTTTSSSSLKSDLKKMNQDLISGSAVAESTNRNTTQAIPENLQELKAEADAQAAYDALPEAMKRRDTLTADRRSDTEKFARRAWTAISQPMETIAAVNRGYDIPSGYLGMHDAYEGYGVGSPMTSVVDMVAGLPGFIGNAAYRQGEQIVDDPLEYALVNTLGLFDPDTRDRAIANYLDLTAVIPAARVASGPLASGIRSAGQAMKPIKQKFIYNAVDPVGYGMGQKIVMAPETFYKNITNPSGRPERIGSMLVPNTADPANFDIGQLGRNRLDAWAKYLGTKEKYGIFQPNYEGQFTFHAPVSPLKFASLYNDILAAKIKNSNVGVYFKDDLVELTRNFNKVMHGDPSTTTYKLNRFLDERGMTKPWEQTRKTGKSNVEGFDDIVFDYDENAVMGGHHYKVTKTPEGYLHFQANDTWDLHPFGKRGNANVIDDDFTRAMQEQHYVKSLRNLEMGKILGGKPFDIKINYLVDPKTFKTIKTWREGGELPKAQEGLPKDYQKFLQYSETAPENRRPDAEWQYGNPRQYDHYGMWDALGKPENFDQALEMNPHWQPDPYDNMYHGFSTNPNTGVWLKSHIPGESHPGDTGWMEYKDFMLSNDRNWGGKNQNLVYDPDLQRMRYVERKKRGGSVKRVKINTLPKNWKTK